MCRILGKEKKHKEGPETNFTDLSPTRRKIWELANEAMIAQAEDMGDETIEAGRKTFAERFAFSNVPYNATTLEAAKVGMEFMMLANMKGKDEGKDISVLALSVLTKLAQVEKDIEATTKATQTVV